MTGTQFLVAVNYALRGTDDDAPTIGNEEADFWISEFNRVKDGLYRNSKVLFDETWEVKSLGSVSATATPSFNTDSSLIAVSDQVYITDTNSNDIYYDIVKARQRTTTGRQFYLAGINPAVLYCSNEIKSTEDIVTGTLYLPGYYMPADLSLTSGSDVVPLSDPYWGVMATAAQIAGNDITYEDKEANLNTKANELYMQMVRNNRRGSYNSPKKNPINVYKIRSPETR